MGKLLEKSAVAIGQFIVRVQEASKSIGLAHYDAAKKDRTNRDWRTVLTSADSAILNDLDTLLARSRATIRNDGYAASAQAGYQRYVVGSGITARASARHPESGEMLDGFNQKVDLLWDDWSNTPEFCDVERTKTLAEKQRLWMNELFAAGGLFIIENYRQRDKSVGLILQEVEYEQADTTKIEHEGRQVRGGIEIDEYGAPIAYHLNTIKHPLNDWSTQSSRIEASRVIHLFRQDRIRQKRGVPWMSAILPSIRNLAMYETYTQLKARNEAAYTGFVEQEQPGNAFTPLQIAKTVGAATPSGESDSTNELQVRIEPGLFPFLKPGQRVTFPPPQTPNTQYPPFVLEQLKRIAAGTGLDLATMVRWYADGNFSSPRQDKLEIYAETDPIQQIYFINKTMRRIRRRFIEQCILEGRLEASGYFENERWRNAYLRTNWKGPPKPSIDRAKDAAGTKLLMSMGLLSPQDWANEQWLEIRDIYAEIAEARQMRKDFGIDDLIDPTFGKVDPREPRPDKKHPGDNGDDNWDLSRLITEPVLSDSIFSQGVR